MTEIEKVNLTDKQMKARKGRSIALAILLAVFVIVVYAVTVIKIGPDVASRSF